MAERSGDALSAPSSEIQPCGSWSPKPSWLGNGQWDADHCECIAPQGHDGKHYCSDHPGKGW